MAPPRPPDLKALEPAALRDTVVQLGLPAFRASQVLHWLYRRGVDDLEGMTNLGAATRARLAEACTLTRLHLHTQRTAEDGTIKVLWTLADGHTIESVWLVSGARRTICLSTQVGCAFSCRFCASGDGPLVRNLTTAEIVDQVLGFQRLCGSRPTNLVYMGMGEPLANYAAVRDSVRILTHPDAYAMSPRRLTVSTVGYLPGLERLIADALPTNLAFSLHAPSDARRAALMPGAERYALADLRDALIRFRRATGRRVTLEYVLLADVNDALADARAVAAFANAVGAKVNLIVYNTVPGSNDAGSALETVEAFQDVLRGKNVLAFVRQSGGRAIQAACGQLRRATPLVV